MKKASHPERGSAMLYICMGIMFLAMLSYLVTKGFRFSSSSLSNDQASMAAQEIIDYGNTVAAAVQKLRLRGCTDTQINFESDILGIANNPAAPSNDSCDVFGTAGGRITARRPQDFPYGHLLFYSGQSDLNGVGTSGCGNTTCSDLYMALYIKTPDSQAICTKINQVLGNTTVVPAPTTTYFQAFTNFTGTYGSHTAINLPYNGMTSACFNYSVDTTISIFYQVLIAR